MKKILSVLLIAFAVSAILMGCGQGSQPADTEKVDEKAVEQPAEAPAEAAK